MSYRYIFEPYKGANSRFHCPSCNNRSVFTRYIDSETGLHVSPNVGRCNRESNCGYHYKPKQYFQDNHISTEISFRQVPQSHFVKKKPISFISNEVLKASLKGYVSNNFVKFLIELLGGEVADQLVKRYCIGTSKHWNGATVFWQIDFDGKIRTGKIMLYNSETGKRIKEPFSHIHWVHKAMKYTDFELKQCLFGEHLLSDTSKPVAIVESEKTAIIASVYFPEFIWLATGSLSNLNADKCKVLKNRKVFLFPDLKGYDKWLDKSIELTGITTFVVSDFLESNATEIEKGYGLDLADYLVRFNYQQFLDERAIEKVKPLVDYRRRDEGKVIRTYGEYFDFVKKNCPKIYSQMLDISSSEPIGKLQI